MVGTESQPSTYVTEINRWRQTKDDSLRAEDGWLSLIGLFWLPEGANTVGANPKSDIPIDAAGVPDQLGTIEFHDGQATLQISADAPVTVDGVLNTHAVLRDDNAEAGPSLVKIGSVSFFVIRRGDAFGVRVRDANNPARLTFTGRNWFPIAPQYQVKGTFVVHDTPRTIPIVNASGQTEMVDNPGKVEFELGGQALSLEAFAAGKDELWFVFKDATSAQSTYGAGRFMYAPVNADGVVSLDFNKAYHPPCAFTPYSTCLRPPKENILPVEVLAGERD
ncbi:MAG: DUF1684 domain-containing protein [Chloroflexota bacterium]